MVWLWQLYGGAVLLLLYGGYVVMHYKGPGSDNYQGFSLIAMILPGIMAIAFKLMVERRGFVKSFRELGFSWGRPLWYLWALLGGLGLALAIYAVSALVGAAAFDPAFTSYTAELQAAGRPVPDDVAGAWLTSLLTLLPLTLLLLMPMGLLVEIGWRGYMLPLLNERFGLRLSLLLQGAVWGIAGAPLVLLRGEYRPFPWLGMLLFFALSGALGTALGVLYLRSRSTVITALGFLSVTVGCATAEGAMRVDPFLGGAGGVVGLGVLSLVALFGLWKGVREDDRSLFLPAGVSEPRY